MSGTALVIATGTSERRTGAPASFRRGWGARLAVWLCLLALVANQFAPLAIAAIADRQGTVGEEFICHAGTVSDQPAPASDDGASGHCPFCVILAAQALTPPTGSVLAAPTPAIALIRIPPPLASGVVTTIRTAAHRSRAPPSLT